MKRILLGGITALSIVLGLGAGISRGEVEVDPGLPVYRPVTGVSGTIKSVGSDTMINLITLWGEGLKRHYPGIVTEMEGKGSSSAPTALIAAQAHFGPMSREMKAKELDDFEKAFGYPPTALATGLDMLAVYVHKDNPIRSLTLQQVDAIFSKNRKGGHATDIRTWGELGLTGDWAKRPISIYGRNSTSGTYGFFKDNALFGGDFKDSVKEQPGSSSVVQGVGSDLYAIGYSGIGYRTADVRALPLALEPGGEPFPADPSAGDYPLARYLWVYVNHAPGSQLDPLRREFVRYVFSRQGQQDVLKDGYFPLPAEIAREQLESVGLSMPGS